MAFISKKQFGFLLLFSMGTCMLTLFLILEFHTMPRAREVQTSANVARLQEAIDAFHADTGKWPPQEPRELLRVLQGQENSTPATAGASQETEPEAKSQAKPSKNYLQDLEVFQDAGQAVDIWQQPLLIEFEQEALRVFSAGKDKKPRTEDDIDGSLWQEVAEARGL